MLKEECSLNLFKKFVMNKFLDDPLLRKRVNSQKYVPKNKKKKHK